jgi:hypothetical protein
MHLGKIAKEMLKRENCVKLELKTYICGLSCLIMHENKIMVSCLSASSFASEHSSVRFYLLSHPPSSYSRSKRNKNKESK